MKILLVNNIASFNSTLAKSMNQIDGVEARYVVTSHNKYIESNQFEVFIPLAVSKRKPFNFIIHKLTYKRKIKKLIEWCDVVYYLWDSLLGEEDLKLAKDLKKPIFIEWVGSDIRDSKKLATINPFFRKIHKEGYEIKKIADLNFKRNVQSKFARYGATVFSCPEMKLFINQEEFPKVLDIFQRIDIKQFDPVYPDPKKRIIKIVHSPSDPIAKGTPYILPIIESLKKQFEIDFVLLTNMTREQVLLEIQSADIFLDQIICGGYGMASCEAMAFGKPVICYLMPELFELGLPTSCPIINADATTLKDQLLILLEDGVLREKYGKESRSFAEQYHSSDKIAQDVLNVFETKLQKV